MKRTDLVRTIESFGCVLVRHGAKHDWYRNPATGVSQPVPRHREIKQHFARHIIRMQGRPDHENPEPGDGDSDKPRSAGQSQ